MYDLYLFDLLELSNTLINPSLIVLFISLEIIEALLLETLKISLSDSFVALSVFFNNILFGDWYNALWLV